MDRVVAFVAGVSSTGSRSFIVSGIENVHGRVHVAGSSTVTVHSTVWAEVRRKRSTSRIVSAFALR